MPACHCADDVCSCLLCVADNSRRGQAKHDRRVLLNGALEFRDGLWICVEDEVLVLGDQADEDGEEDLVGEGDASGLPDGGHPRSNRGPVGGAHGGQDDDGWMDGWMAVNSGE